LRRVRSAGVYSVSSGLAVLFLAPMLWTLYASLHREDTWTLSNYERLATYGSGLGVYAWNTLVVAAVTVTVTVVLTTLGGYAVVRFTFPGRDVLFLVTLAILMVPHATMLIPLYILLGWIGLQNSLVGLALMLAMFQLPFGLFMMRNSFEAIPIELEEAAMVDGCGPTTVLRHVLLRAVAPGMVTVALFSFLASWNEFVAPLILITDDEKFTLPVALFNLQSGSLGSVDYGALLSGVVAAAVPCLLLFLLLQRYYVRGFIRGALKG
jgi:multiple sugar transport system permease protein